MNPRILILPGIGNSGPQHWQTLWEESGPNFQRVQQRDWDHPNCREWVATLETTIEGMDSEVILVAHSLACLVVAHWAVETRLKLRAALLVAVPDPTGSGFPKEAVGFSPVPLSRFPFESIAVASSNDPYGPIDFQQWCASAWGSRFVSIGAAGHINVLSGLDRWPEGFSLLQSLITQPRATADAIG